MQNPLKKTLTITALGLAFTGAAAGTASAAAPGAVLGGTATSFVPGGAHTTDAQNALADQASALSGNPSRLLPSGNHVEGDSVVPLHRLVAGIPVGA